MLYVRCDAAPDAPVKPHAACAPSVKFKIKLNKYDGSMGCNRRES
jgi:hypothetical protein